MRRLLLFSCFLVWSSGLATAQLLIPSAVVWQQAYGGSDLDSLGTVRPTSDGGYIVAGSSEGFGGNKGSTNYGRDDAWILRLDSTGNKIWETDLGGSSYDYAGDVQQTADGGFLVVGSSDSDVEGTKTSPNQGGLDAWVIRMDANGNQLWDRTFGGTNSHFAYRIIQLTNGGFVIGGSSIGQGANNSTFGGGDYWLLALDANGNQLWERAYGGTEEDHLTSVEQTRDGGFVLCGYSLSGQSGNKTSTNYGIANVWIVRTDATGNVLWQQTVGGDDSDSGQCVKETADGGFIIGANSWSGTTGNKSAPYFGFVDAWLIKLDANGNKLWDRAYGGAWEDGINRLVTLPDGGFLLGAYSDGEIVFDNTDWWFIRTDAMGNPLWDFTIGGNSLEYLWSLEHTPDGGFIAGGVTYSPTSGTKTNDYFGVIDYWMVKLGPESVVDSDGDGVSDDKDECPNTSAGVVVNASGCSIEQIVPCDGPWKNHGQYLQAVKDTIASFIQNGLVSRQQGKAIVQAAAQSDCGKAISSPPKDHGPGKKDKDKPKRP